LVGEKEEQESINKEKPMNEQQSAENVYLEQVRQHQKKVDRELRRQVPARRKRGLGLPGSPAPPPEGEDGEPTGRAVDYRITGLWRWRTVVVPPNVYVVHTRRGHKQPRTIGLGVSFRFDPVTDAFLIIPAAVQTILINANCICIERQGILVQAYVQWIIEDIETAYRKLDFSDPEDPMRLVNIQLSEQAEAAIKDKVATMSIDEVLSDKQPIIEELTHRLRMVAEGNREGDGSSGLGLKIVTVQIKEAVVSSTRLWQNLQIPFRTEREKLARLAELESREKVAARELEGRTARETAELEAEGELAKLRAAKEQARYDMERAEKVRRHRLEQQAEQQAIAERNATAKARKEAELELVLQGLEMEKRRIEQEIEKVRTQVALDEVQAEQNRAQVVSELELKELRDKADVARSEQELALLKTRREIENDLSESYIQAQLIASLPEIAERLPAPQELRTTLISSDGKEGAMTPLLSFLASTLSLFENVLKRPDETKDTAE
jgi:flotillin